MDSKELIKAGNLDAALKQLTEEVKNSPADAAKRTLLFQVLCYQGEWDKAERHLDLLAAQSTGAEIGVQLYKNLIAAERERLEVAQGKRRPDFVTKAPPYLELWFEARDSLSRGESDEARSRFDRIEKELPAVTGTVDGMPFTGFGDVDASLGRFLELFVYDHYLWVPFEALSELSVAEPKTLLDLLWSPGSISTRDGFTTKCYLPVLYPCTPLSGDERVRLGRVTDWNDFGAGLFLGSGQHVYVVGDEERALLEMREIRFGAPAGEA